MGNCLIKKLQQTVEDENLKEIGTIYIRIPEELCNINLLANDIHGENVSIELVSGNVQFMDWQYHQLTLPYVFPNNRYAFNLIATEPSVLRIKNKYGLKGFANFRYRVDNNNNFLYADLNTSDFKYSFNPNIPDSSTEIYIDLSQYSQDSYLDDVLNGNKFDCNKFIFYGNFKDQNIINDYVLTDKLTSLTLTTKNTNKILNIDLSKSPNLTMFNCRFPNINITNIPSTINYFYSKLYNNASIDLSQLTNLYYALNLTTSSFEYIPTCSDVPELYNGNYYPNISNFWMKNETIIKFLHAITNSSFDNKQQQSFNPMNIYTNNITLPDECNQIINKLINEDGIYPSINIRYLDRN